VEKMKIEKYSAFDLLDVMGGYLVHIKRDGGDFPTVVIDDLEKSITYVLEKNGYNGRYAAYLKNG
jgi:hypothetical protein